MEEESPLRAACESGTGVSAAGGSDAVSGISRLRVRISIH